MNKNDLIDIISVLLQSADESLAQNDVNSALKQIHECLSTLKNEKESYQDEQ